MGGHTFHPCKQRPKSILCVYCRWSYCGHIWVVYTCLVGQRIGTCSIAVYLCTRSVCGNLQETCQEGFSLHARGCCACAGGGNNDARLSLTCPRIPKSQFFFLWFPFCLPYIVLWRLPFWHLMVAGSAREHCGPFRCLCANGGNEELLVHLCVCVSVCPFIHSARAPAVAPATPGSPCRQLLRGAHNVLTSCRGEVRWRLFPPPPSPPT